MSDDDFYATNLLGDPQLAQKIVICRYTDLVIPTLKPELAEKYSHRCDISRLVGIFTSVLDTCTAFPTFIQLSQIPRGEPTKTFRCEHNYEDFLWSTKIEFGCLDGTGKAFVNVRMPNDGFVYLSPMSSPLKDHIDHTQRTITRHKGIPHWHEVNTEQLHEDLQPLLVFFANWLCGRPHASGESFPDTITELRPSASAWYNNDGNRMDIHLSASTPDGRECVWSLTFEPWSPVIKSKAKNTRVFTLTDLMNFQAAQAKKKK